MHTGFHSGFPPCDRDIIVYLPPGYDENKGARRPVLSLHDGQNLFGEETGFGGQARHVDETAEDLIRPGKIRPAIMVGSYNTGPNRIDEYTPTADVRGHAGGQARLYAATIMKELKPIIDAEYRTLRDAANTAMAGASTGGLVRLYIGPGHPDIFGKPAVLLPSVWWNRGVIPRIVRDLPAPGARPLVRVDIGAAEGRFPRRIPRDTRHLGEMLCRKGREEGDDPAYGEDDGALHNEAARGRRMPRIVSFLFGGER
jgi:enterochelin esterase-like enzyme